MYLLYFIYKVDLFTVTKKNFVCIKTRNKLEPPGTNQNNLNHLERAGTTWNELELSAPEMTQTQQKTDANPRN